MILVLKPCCFLSVKYTKSFILRNVNYVKLSRPIPQLKVRLNLAIVQAKPIY